MGKRIIVSISSDIGLALAKDWLAAGHEVIGTYRSASPELDEISDLGATLVRADLADGASVTLACNELLGICNDWDTVVIAPGLQDPVSMFAECDFGEWASSIAVNFTAPLQILHALFPLRNEPQKNETSVVFFAGGGTNNATVRYSAYTIAKIASIKICELLDAEIEDMKFTIIGPGWVKTKIHESTLAAKERAGDNYEKTLQKLDSDECVPIGQVVKCVNWVIATPRNAVGGRNISLVYDDWGNPELDRKLSKDPDMYKLRRRGNDVLLRAVPISGKSETA